MKKFLLTLLLSAFVFVSVHDYIIVAIDQDTQSELYLYESGQIEAVCDVTKTHEALHEALMAIDVVFAPLITHNCVHDIIDDASNFFPTSSPQSIFYPPIA